MKFTAKEVANIVGGVVFGDGEATARGISKIDETNATAGTLTFLANLKYTGFLYTTEASVVLVPSDFEPSKSIECTLVKVSRPYVALSKLMAYYAEVEELPQRIEDAARVAPDVALTEGLYVGHYTVVAPGVRFGKNVKIHAHVSIETDVEIGDGTVIMEGAKIKKGTRIGKECKIHPQAVIGSDGFGFAKEEDGTYQKIPHLGNVVLEDEVDVGAGTTIDRASMGTTHISRGVKLDNLIQVGHNVEIGASTVIAAQTGISGSVKIGRDCMIGGQVGISGHITIGDRVMVAAKSGVLGNVPDDSKLQGCPAFEIGSFHRSYVVFRKLSRWSGKINFLEKAIKKLGYDESKDA